MLNATEMEAATAVELRLLHEVVEPQALDAAVERESAAFLRCAPGAVTDCKRLIEFVSTHDTAANIPYTANQLADRWETDELRQGIEAFLAKRKPSWNVERS